MRRETLSGFLQAQGQVASITYTISSAATTLNSPQRRQQSIIVLTSAKRERQAQIQQKRYVSLRENDPGRHEHLRDGGKRLAS
jgi:hypothetical protein